MNAVARAFEVCTATSRPASFDTAVRISSSVGPSYSALLPRPSVLLITHVRNCCRSR